MVNDPMPWQLTVAQLKRALAEAQDGAVVGLRLPAGFAVAGQFDRVFNLCMPSDFDGPSFTFSIQKSPDQDD